MKRMYLAFCMASCAITMLAKPSFATEVLPSDANLYMGAPVSLGEAPNGAIANQRLLDGIDKSGWLQPTIEKPAEGIWVFGGYALAPITVIDTDDRGDR